MQLRAARHSFYGRDRPTFDLYWQHEAAQLRPAVDEHSAGAALAKLTPVLGSSQLHVFAQHLEERLVDRNQELGAFAVDLQRHDLAGDVARHLVLHDAASIAFSAAAPAQRSGATAVARPAAGTGPGGGPR